jgi:hypothetical protein
MLGAMSIQIHFTVQKIEVGTSLQKPCLNCNPAMFSLFSARGPRHGCDPVAASASRHQSPRRRLILSSRVTRHQQQQQQQQPRCLPALARHAAAEEQTLPSQKL